MTQAFGHAGHWGLGCWAALLFGLLFVLGEGAAGEVRAQDAPNAHRDSLDLISRYRMARYRTLARHFVAQMPMPVRPPEPMPVPSDSLFAALESDEEVETGSEEPTFPLEDVRRVRDLERSWFQNKYGNTDWSFLGAGSRLTVLDTTRTWVLRARLQAHFGDPTHTPAEVDLDQWRSAPDSTRNALVQFAYWFVVNDSIPVRVTDVNGPTDRGLIVSTESTYRDRLRALRDALLQPLRREERAPYVDYYYSDERRRWYRVGFDGQSFFREHISRHDIVRGRRPQLETVRPDSASAEPSDTTESPR